MIHHATEDCFTSASKTSIAMPGAAVATFRRNFRLAVFFSYLGMAIGLVGGATYAAPVFTGSAAAYSGYASEWRFWTEPSGIASVIGLIISIISLSAAWSCLAWKGEIGEGLDRAGQGIITRSMSISGLTIIGVIFCWLLRGVF